MNEPKGSIVPFGKYKGRLIEELLLDDPVYLQWLSGQEWFRAKFAFLNQVIINRGSEPEETPDVVGCVYSGSTVVPAADDGDPRSWRRARRGSIGIDPLPFEVESGRLPLSFSTR